ncbi:sulfatase family protein [Tundrisphaera lichenicola]|uniref:sulfatase family protein n=1 Tax=Tundrisphaera lichenicola TaxID=2029860 RepID=UPI003EBA474F
MPKRRSWFRLVAWCLLLAPVSLAHPDDGRPIRPRPPKPAEGSPRGPNILILIGDDQAGGTLGIDGDPHRATPRLDALARQGVRFDRAYCSSPVCTASRQSFITGLLPHAVGVTRLTTPLPDDALTLGEWLGDLGYDTAAFGKMHFNGPAKHGFAERIDAPDWNRWLRDHMPPGGDRRRKWRPFVDPAAVWLNAAGRSYGLPASAMQSTYLVDRAAEFFVRHKDQSRSNPFLMVLGFSEPHSPFIFPDEWAGRFRPEDFPVPPVSEADRANQPKIFTDLSPREKQGIAAAHYTSLSFLDHQIGRALDALDASGLADDTIVVYFGDNGYLVGQHGRFEKHVLLEPGARVPLILRWPGHLPADRRVADLVELVDVLPTLLELAGQPSPPDLQGRSLKALAMGEPGAKGREFAFSEYLENEEAMVRSDRYKLIAGTGARRRLDGYETANPLPGPYERLYDLEADPDEATDLRDRPELAPVVDRLRRELHDRLVSTRGGQTAVPPGLSEIEAIRWCLVPQD